MLNGKTVASVTELASTLKTTVATMTSETDKVRAIYLMLFTRSPKEAEEKKALEILAHDPQTGFDDLVASLINTQQFIFIQ
jgi:hypothetical protein